MQILVGRSDSYLLTHTKKYMTPIHALIFEKHVKMLFMQDMLKSRCKFITLLEKYEEQKQLGWEVNFSEVGFAGSGAHKPRLELEGSALDFFAACSEASGGFNCVSKVLLKSQCKNMAFGRGKPNHTLARCAFFTNTVLQNH